jgi:phospholipid/cholesterol/gamma-HCH transport system substrate-binding protein
MENSAHATATGLFVVVLTLLLAAAGFWLGGGTIRGVPYDLITRSSVAGLSTGATVRLLGVDVGEVQSISLDPLEPRQVRVRALLRPGVRLMQGTRATISYLGLSGTAYVELEIPEEASQTLRSSAASPAKIPMQASGLAQFADAGRGLIRTLNQTLERVNAVLTPQTLQNVSLLIGHLNEAAAGANVLMHDLQPTARDADGTLKRLNRLTDPLRRTIGDADTLIVRADAAGGTMDAIRSGAASTGQAAHDLESVLIYRTLPQVDDLVRRLSRASDALNVLLQQLQRNPQSLVFGQPAPRPGPGEPGFDRSRNR